MHLQNSGFKLDEEKMNIDSLKKILAVEIILLFITLIITPAASQNSEKQFLPATKGDSVNWTINGTRSNSGWYISPITMSCTYNHDLIKAVYYEYDGSGSVQYTEPFTIYIQGKICFSWCSMDYDGNMEPTKTITIAIDYTPPVIQLNVEKIAFMKWFFSVNASDSIGGVARVEFYLDDQFLTNVTAAPYEWFWTGAGLLHTVKAIAYDCAGNNASSSTIIPYSYSYRMQIPNQFILKFFERFPHVFLILRQFLGL
jgi:hypothetical protein